MADAPRWLVTYHRDVEKELRQLPRPFLKRVLEAMQALADEPRPPGSSKLVGHELWKLRIGIYRVIYAIDDDRRIVSVYRIGHRRDVYRNL